ncbi:helix-turn-helix transcriptional regulator [Mesorhizobium sp. SB112]|uniref:helix-turn-helix domain-containing protein n=1 Tax=Mesorhizobium sp. SB112 TaxID=3151853 RepID=UPI003262F854
MATSLQENPFGDLLKEWRQRRRMSQLDLALDAEISQRHLSFVESGRSRPSRDMVLKLAEHMSVPLRQRNRLLLAAGFAPSYEERGLDHPSMKPAMSAVQAVLNGHEPYPAIAVDRQWNMVASNNAIAPFLEGVSDPALLESPVNVLRLALHPKGIAPRIVNLSEWRTHLIERLKMQIDASADAGLIELEKELSSYPGRGSSKPYDPHASVAVPLLLRMDDTILSFISTITIFGTPLDVTLSELAIESFFPADRDTGLYLQKLAAQRESALY